MSFITWTEEQYGTGVGFADDQHKDIFASLNALHDAIPNADNNVIDEKLDALITSVVEHFQAEEKAMQEKGYSDFDAHKAEHDELIKTCADLQTKFKAGEVEINQETTSFVKNWLDVHIPNVDRLYMHTLNA